MVLFYFAPADVSSLTVLPLPCVHVCVNGPTDDNSRETDIVVDVPAFVLLSTYSADVIALPHNTMLHSTLNSTAPCLCDLVIDVIAPRPSILVHALTLPI